MEQRFWPDGAIRASGREYNGLIESGCYQRGELSCLSCHAMHDSNPKAQLRAGMEGDGACLSCHQAYQARLQSHTHHAPDSVGSRCANCHMPYTTHGLLRAMRSHRIDSPSVQVSAATGRPNACNLCHLDKSLAWAAERLTAWYEQPEVEMTTDAASTSAALLWLLRGDAVQRAIAAWHLGWESAHDASGREWQAPFLAELLTDPYAAVRYNAHRALRQLPGFADFSYDYVGPQAAREQAREQARRRWEQRPSPPPGQTGRRLLTTPEGRIQRDRLTHLLGLRNDYPIRIAE